MPIYEYICKECNQKFEAIRSFSQADAPIQCSRCGSADTRRTVSACFCKGDNAPALAPVSSGGCSGCSGGNCSHCGH